MDRRRSLFPLLAFTVTIIGCGDSTGAGDQLTAEETAAVLQQVTIAFAGALANINTSSPAMAALGKTSQVPFQGSWDGSTSCTHGGAITVEATYSGDLDTETSAFNYEYDMVFDLVECRVQANNVLFTINGDPNLTIAGDYEGTTTSYTYNYSQEGGFSFESDDGRSGACEYTYSLMTTYNGSAFSFEYDGNICGVDLSDFSS